VTENNPVRVIEAFIGELDLAILGFKGVVPETTGRPAYHPAALLRVYLYGYLNRTPSSRRLERETQRNIELMWLTGRLMPDFKTIADFRKDNAPAIRATCRQFVMLCRRLDLFSEAVIAIAAIVFPRSAMLRIGGRSSRCARCRRGGIMRSRQRRKAPIWLSSASSSAPRLSPSSSTSAASVALLRRPGGRPSGLSE
jgi:transposase